MRFIILFLLSMLSLNLFGQINESKPSGAVIYEFVHVYDTLNKERPRKEQMLLLYSPKTSSYKSYSEILDAVERKRRYEEAENKGLSTVNTTGLRPLTGNQLFYEVDSKKFIEAKKIRSKKYLVSLDDTPINWNIEEETKKIGDFHCQKAQGVFKGRKYTAWFSIDLPYNAGPWKINGLPGLVLEAYDENKEVAFKFKEFLKENDLGAEGLIQKPVDYALVSNKDYNKLVDAYNSNPELFSNGNAEVAVRAIDAQGNVFKPGTRKSSLNNPIEKSAN